MVLGLNGRLPLNTVGNLQARAIGDQTTPCIRTWPARRCPTAPGPSSLVVNMGVPGKADRPPRSLIPGRYTGHLPRRSLYFQSTLSSQVYLDAPLWDHASHLGFSVNEINPKFALQNAPSNLYPNATVGATQGIPFGAYPVDYTNLATAPSYTQYDNAGVSVALTQMRNLLAGHRSPPTSNPIEVQHRQHGSVNFASLSPTPNNQDVNVAIVNGQPYVIPNNVADQADPNGNTNGIVRAPPACRRPMGRAPGHPQAILPATQNPALYSGAGNQPISATRCTGTTTRPRRPVVLHQRDQRRGRRRLRRVRSLPAQPGREEQHLRRITHRAEHRRRASDSLHIPLNVGYIADRATTFNRTYVPEAVDYFDSAGQVGIASERLRRFVTPIDPSGSGRIVSFPEPAEQRPRLRQRLRHQGADRLLPLLPTGGDAPGSPLPLQQRDPSPTRPSTSPITPTSSTSGLGQQYLMPVLLPAGQSANPSPRLDLRPLDQRPPRLPGRVDAHRQYRLRPDRPDGRHALRLGRQRQHGQRRPAPRVRAMPYAAMGTGPQLHQPPQPDDRSESPSSPTAARSSARSTPAGVRT